MTQTWSIRYEGWLLVSLGKYFKGTERRFSSSLSMLLNGDVLLLQPFCAHEVHKLHEHMRLTEWKNSGCLMILEMLN